MTSLNGLGVLAILVIILDFILVQYESSSYDVEIRCPVEDCGLTNC